MVCYISVIFRDSVVALCLKQAPTWLMLCLQGEIGYVSRM